ncbi:hypothetical protein [Mesorhizobium sp. 1M-11]|uniref:hypothetical protein n=1 Tax=Mesorhizobium sp. 1M-11 TaxID=1529006 RepID=UPI001910AD5B|nr:hypothetical protein [Mesorhizobium sp. 1M-11]
MTVLSKPVLGQRLLPLIGLFLLSPICAEYLIGYAESTYHPLEMMWGLLVFAPLYGSIALLIREIARRTGRGWPTMLLLAAAFGLIQAGLIDQSLFNPHYGADLNIPYWDAERLPTWLGQLGISANLTLDFVSTHIVWSFAAPIAVVECCAPRIADRPWLGRIGILLMVSLYLAAAAFVFDDHLRVTGFMATKAQLVATVACALLLGIAALLVPVHTEERAGYVPAPWLVAAFVLAILALHIFSSPDWTGVSASLLAFAGCGALIATWSGRIAWKNSHVLGIAAAALLANALTSFVIQPAGEPALAVKYAVNGGMLLGVLVLAALAYRQLRTANDEGWRRPQAR